MYVLSTLAAPRQENAAAIAGLPSLSRAEESHLVNAAAYALPRELGGLSRDQIRTLIKSGELKRLLGE